MNCRWFKPVAMSTGSCSRIWSGGFFFTSPHSSLLLRVHTDLADIPWKTMRNQFKIIKWTNLRAKMKVLSYHIHMRIFCTSLFIGITDVWLFPATHPPVAAVSNSVIGHRCCDIYPHLVMQSSPDHSMELLSVEFWKRRCFPVSLQESWMFPLCYPMHVLLCFPWECLWASCIRLELLVDNVPRNLILATFCENWLSAVKLWELILKPNLATVTGNLMTNIYWNDAFDCNVFRTSLSPLGWGNIGLNTLRHCRWLHK